MAATGLSVFDTTLQKTHIWLNEIAQNMGEPSRQRAYEALRGTLHALRDRLTVEEGAQFAAQLPLLIKGIYYDGWTPTGKPVRLRDKAEFIERAKGAFPRNDDVDVEKACESVFRVVEKKVSEGELGDVRSVLPKDISAFWSAAVGR